MNILVGVWSVILGGVFLPGTDLDVAAPGLAGAQGPLAGFDLPGAPMYPDLGPDVSAWEQGYSPQAPGGGRPETRYRAWESGSADSGRAPDRGAPPRLPLSPYDESAPEDPWSTPSGAPTPFTPTDPSAAIDTYPWAPPTARAPAEAQAPQQQVYPDYASRQPGGLGSAPGASSAYPAAARVTKPYQNYRSPAAVSPYMQLGQVTSYYDDVDSYNQLVRPRLEQIQADQQIDRQVIGLQNSVQTLNRQTQTPRGVAIPQYFMNHSQYFMRHGAYYPGLQ
jgi:hypothetical protein